VAPKYRFAGLVDFPGLMDACNEAWYNQTPCAVDD
jgi:hypothetical protein